MARLKPIQAPPQFTLGFSELEWQGYKASCSRLQQSLDGLKTTASKNGPDAEALGPRVD